MKISHLIIFIGILLIPVCMRSQPIPQAALDAFIKIYADKGMKLEKSVPPKFDRVHPTDMYWNTECYPGKKVVVVTLTSKKPSDLLLKVTYKSQVAPKDHVVGEIKLAGSIYWTDYVVTGFPAGFDGHSPYCMNVVTYDKNDIDLPVYTFIFTKDI